MTSHPHRFFVSDLSWIDPPCVFTLDHEALRACAPHIQALRIQRGETIILFDGRGLEAIATVDASTRPIALTVISTTHAEAIDFPTIHLIQCVPKGDAIEHIVAMTTELGARDIHLAISERTIARPDPLRAERQRARLQRIAQDAAQIGGQPWVAKVHAPTLLLEIAKRTPPDARKIIFWEESKATLKQEDCPRYGETVWLIIGPEGGLAENEIAALQSFGFVHRSLGPWVLRVQTAASAAIARLTQMNL